MVRETRHLWVGNLPENVREEKIIEHFKRWVETLSDVCVFSCDNECTASISLLCHISWSRDEAGGSPVAKSYLATLLSVLHYQQHYAAFHLRSEWKPLARFHHPLSGHMVLPFWHRGRTLSDKLILYVVAILSHRVDFSKAHLFTCAP